MTFTVVGSFLLEVNMDKKTVEKLKKELLTKKSHDIFKNVQAIFDLAYSTGGIWICALSVERYAPIKQRNSRPHDLSALDYSGSYTKRCCCRQSLSALTAIANAIV